MELFIRATGNISPQHTFGHGPFLTDPVANAGNRLFCVEPDYKAYIDVKQIRRMSRVIKMGAAAAMECLQESGTGVPDAIVTGTGYGCLEDTGVFLSKMVEQREELLTPTSFIQSTHNTVGAQIALMIKCNGYNNVFVHRSLSFETALLDAMLLLKEQEANNVLVGGVDETTAFSHTILTRFGLYKRDPVSNSGLYDSASAGTIAGEGAAFFLLTGQHSTGNYARLDGLATFSSPPGVAETCSKITAFLSENAITSGDIDLVITGKNGDSKGDKIYDEVRGTVLNNIAAVNYKHLCGEYPTSVSFALWVAANILRSGEVPVILGYKGATPKEIRRILIYNHSQNIHHSLLLLSAC